MVRLADIAEALGLNVATVSKAMNDSSDINVETKKRVFAEAERLGYVRRTKKSTRKDSENIKKDAQIDHEGLIGIICPELTSRYYAPLVTSLISRFRSKKYQAMVMISGYSEEIERQLISQVISLNVAGLIMITEGSDLTPIFEGIPESQQIPTVVMGLNYQARAHDVVSVAEEHGVQAIVDYLIGQGYTNFAFLGDSLVGNRLNYLMKSLENCGIQMQKDQAVLLDERDELCGYKGMEMLLNRISFPCAVIAGYDRIALGAYRMLSERNIRIPEDIALVGIDNANFCDYLPTSLTSLNYDVEGESCVAAAILLGKIRKDGPQYTQTAAITPHLVVRESTKLQRTK